MDDEVPPQVEKFENVPRGSQDIQGDEVPIGGQGNEVLVVHPEKTHW